jgi:hypothetical protein
MRLTHVLTAVNDNPAYAKFIPLFVEQWRRVYPEIEPVIVYVGEEVPAALLMEYGRYIRKVSPIAGRSTAVVAQMVRLVYPCLLPEDATVVITDMDMIPGRSNYFRSPALTACAEDAFVSLRPKGVVAANQIAMCYNAARVPVWRELFGVHTEADIQTYLEAAVPPLSVATGVHAGAGWYSDQEHLWSKVSSYMGLVFLDDGATGFRRLDYFHHGYNMDIFVRLLNEEGYSDCHLYAYKCTWDLNDIEQIIRRLGLPGSSMS